MVDNCRPYQLTTVGFILYNKNLSDTSTRKIMPPELRKVTFLMIGTILGMTFLVRTCDTENDPTKKDEPTSGEWPAMEWKRRLNGLAFSGMVADIYNDRNIYAIKLKYIILKNENCIPQFTPSFEYDSKTFTFPVYGENVHRNPLYGLKEGDVLIKKQNNDTCSCIRQIVNPNTSLKYLMVLQWNGYQGDGRNRGVCFQSSNKLY